MKITRYFLFFSVCLLGLQNAQARKFSFSNEVLAGYLRTSYGLSRLGDSAFANSSGTSTVFSDKVTQNLSGELGFLFALEKTMTVRLGIEFMQGRQLTDAVGANASGTKYMDLTSKTLAINSAVTFEKDIGGDKTSRTFVFVGAGYTNLSLDNEYTFTTAGSTFYSSINDYIEKSEQSFISGHAGLGYETLMLDNVTVAFEAGFRVMRANKLTYKHDYSGAETTLLGDKSKGDTVVNHDGSNRDIDLGGYFAGMTFRFYIPIF